MRLWTSNWISILITFLFHCDIGYAVDFLLSTFDCYVVDDAGERFKLVSVNCRGPHTERQIVDGLRLQSLDYIVSLIEEIGFYSVRLPFSNETLHDSKAVDKVLVANVKPF